MKSQVRLFSVGVACLIAAAAVEMVDAFPLRDAVAGVFSVVCWYALVKLGFLGDHARDKVDGAVARLTGRRISPPLAAPQRINGTTKAMGPATLSAA